MFVVHFIENNSVILSQLRNQIPSVDENIKVKGRKGKVLNVNKVEENIVQVQISLEKVKKNPLPASDPKKKKR